jgi:excisionase family DNA binding protein
MAMSKIHDLRTHPDRFVTAQELAEYYRISDRTVYRLVEKGALKAVKVGASVRIPTQAARKIGPLSE